MDAPVPEKKVWRNFDIGHIVFLITILFLVIAAAGAIVYSSKRYVTLGQDYQEKSVALQEKTTEAADLEKRLADREAQLEQLKTEQRAGSASDVLVRQKNKEIDALKKELEETKLQLSALQNYERCDELLNEFKAEYNDAADRLFKKTKDVCAELYFGGTTYDDRRALKNMIDAEVKVDEYKAGGNVTN